MIRILLSRFTASAKSTVALVHWQRVGGGKDVSLSVKRGAKASAVFLTVMGAGWTFGLLAIGDPGSDAVLTLQARPLLFFPSFLR